MYTVVPPHPQIWAPFHKSGNTGLHDGSWIKPALPVNSNVWTNARDVRMCETETRSVRYKCTQEYLMFLPRWQTGHALCVACWPLEQSQIQPQAKLKKKHFLFLCTCTFAFTLS